MQYPRHIGIIPDGNRTRAKQRNLPSFVGHTAGFEQAKKLVRYALWETPVEVMTLWWASTENIQERSPEELSYLYEIYQTITDDMEALYIEHGIGFKRIGSPDGLPKDLVDFFYTQERKYPSRSGKYSILAVNYGGRDEILRGIQQFVQSHPLDQLTEEWLSDAMDLWIFPPIELVIRTKAQVAKRLSGFMTWRIGYAELYFSEKYFPDFDVASLQESLERFDSIAQYRNFGK